MNAGYVRPSTQNCPLSHNAQGTCIQGYCKALQPKIAVLHGIWRDLIMHIGKQSREENEDGSRVEAFPTTVSAVKHEQ